MGVGGGSLDDDLSSDRTGSGSMSATDAVVTADTSGCATVQFNVTGTWVGTIRIEGTIDSGTTWNLSTAIDSAVNIFATFTDNRRVVFPCGGYSQVRLRMSSYTSGTASVIWDAGEGLAAVPIYNSNAPSLKVAARSDILSSTGSAASLNADLFAATDVGGYQTASIQITGTFVGTISVQGSDDNSTFINCFPYDISRPFDYPLTGITVPGIYYIPMRFRYLRVRMTAYTSGTASSTTVLDTLPAEGDRSGDTFWTQTDTYTLAGNGTTVDTSNCPMRNFALQVTSTGVVTSWTVVVEASLDNVSFTTVVTHTNITGSGNTAFSGANISPCLYFRTRCSAISLGIGTNLVAKVLGAE